MRMVFTVNSRIGLQCRAEVLHEIHVPVVHMERNSANPITKNARLQPGAHFDPNKF